MIFPNLFYAIIVCMCCNPFNQFFIDVLLGYIQSFVITNNAAMNKPVSILLFKKASLLSGRRCQQ